MFYFTDIFYTEITPDKNCSLRVKDAKLNYEHEESFKLKIRLDSVAGYVNPARSIANVRRIFCTEGLFI